MYKGWGLNRVSTFQFQKFDLCKPARIGTARMYYRVGWTAIIFWDAGVYFADGIYGFDEMINLVRSRFGLQWPLSITREYDDEI